MPDDMEKVIHGLELAKEDICERFTSGSQKSVDCLRIDKAIAMLKEQPEIVRCKDCKWFHQAFKSEGRCLKHDNDYHEPNWFCADGRMDDDA